MKRILFSAIIIALFMAVGATGALRAATTQPEAPKQGMTITPPTFEINANPGDTTNKNSIRVDNLSDKPLHVTTLIKNFVALGEEGQVGLNDEDSVYSLAHWIKLDQKEATIPVKGSVVFTFTIEVPANAEPGGRFGSIIFKTDVPSFSGGSAIGQELGALVMLRVAGEVKEQASVEAFESLKGFWEYGPVAFETRLKNSGSVHIKPTGTITITDIFGNKVSTLTFDAKNVLPGATRKIASEWPQQSLFGLYTATLSLQYGTSQQIITATASFWAIPIRTVLFWLALAVIVGVLLFLGRERIKRASRILLGKD